MDKNEIESLGFKFIEKVGYGNNLAHQYKSTGEVEGLFLFHYYKRNRIQIEQYHDDKHIEYYRGKCTCISWLKVVLANTVEFENYI